MKSQQEQELRTQVEQLRGRLDGLAEDLCVVDREVDNLAPQREKHELLAQVCGSLERLGELGAASLFWGEGAEAADVSGRLREVHQRLGAFQAQLDQLDQQRQALLDEIGRDEEALEILGEDLDFVLDQEERRKLEWIVEREISPVRPRLQRMAWTHGGEDDRRFYKSLGISLAVSLVLGAVLPLITVPMPERFLPENLPRRLAQLVRPEKTRPVPPPPVVADTPPEQTPEQQPEPVEPEPIEQPPETPTVAKAEPSPSVPAGPGDSDLPAVAEAQRGTTVHKAGILAFREKFASLAKDDVAPRLGAAARFGNADEASKASSATRSMLTTNAPGSSGGINVASLSRNVGGGGGGGGGGSGGGMHGVQVGRATSSIASIGGGGGGNSDRPRARGGQAASRTDEEIQIAFDRYKAAFYRLYNRELRKDPTLRGQMVLRLTIEPDGSVSMCTLQSTDMNAPDLAAGVVSRVKTISFGAKEGVEALTIVYPIDFLPKA